MGELRAVAVSGLHVIVPEGIDDPARPSGGNTYDRRVCDGLVALGWTVYEHVGGDLARALGRVPDDAVVLVDGLIASPAPEALMPHAGRLRQVVLLHMPLGNRRERAALAAAESIVTTSQWARRLVAELYVEPGTQVEAGTPLALITPDESEPP